MLFRPIRTTLAPLMIAAFCSAPECDALTITTNYIAPGQQIPGVGVALETPANIVGGGTLESVFRAAADAWERAIGDPFAVTVNYGWYPTAGISATAYHQGLSVGGNPQRETAGSIVFNSSPTRAFFLDPTPYEHEEFGALTTATGNFGGGPINLRREYAPIIDEARGAIDLLSTAIHELGHAMGLAGWSFYTSETADGDIDVTIEPYAGSQIPVSSSHLNVVGPAMSSTGRTVGYRRTITDLDLIAVAQVSQFRQLTLQPSADFNGDWLVNQGDLSAWAAAFDSSSALADANGDGVTDGADFLVWQRQAALDPAPLTSGQAVVPEPSAASLLAAFGLIVVSASRKRAD